MPEAVRIILVVLIFVAALALFIFTYVLNKRTPKPENCEHVGEECEGCRITTCANYKQQDDEKGNQ